MRKLKAESVTGMYAVVTQLGLGLHVVYFCPFAGTGPLVQAMFCRLLAVKTRINQLQKQVKDELRI